MIRYFRKFRLQFLKENNTGKYLKHAIGEIVLVMIGILLALQVNNWNEGRKKHVLIKSQLLNLVASLRSDSIMWSRTMNVNEFRSSSIEYLLEKADQTFNAGPSLPKADSTFIWQGPYPDSLDMKFIRKSFSWFTRGFNNVVVDRTALNEINNLGLYSEIKNDQLKGKIHDYYAVIDFHFGDLNIQNRVNMQDEFNDFLRDSYNVNPVLKLDIADPIELIKNDKGIILRLKTISSEANWHCLQAVNAKNMAQEIIEMIEHEIAQ
ncbi:MAG: hypothetical protein E4H26_03780 [Flavobacteriales bacterium]|nr:MAG: hypothetical protein E4H26_03780 [Flavobacteriales bacterium]